MIDVELQIGFVTSLLVSIVLVATTKWHGKFTLDGTTGVQKFHAVPTPRVGGIAIFSGLLVAWFACGKSDQVLFGRILMAGLPAFCFGVAEDITKRVSVRTRLIATMASGVLAWQLTGARIAHIGFSELDWILAIGPVSLLFTAFAVGGLANAVNIIDGFNGLASGTVVVCLVSLGLIAENCGDAELARLCFVICAVTAGFFLVNFPFGKLFLGDGGAYLLGFIVAWLAVSLAYRNSSISVWAPLLACAYPVFETVFTILRRIWAKSHPGEPDNSHLHSLIKIGISSQIFGSWRADLRNASVSPFSWSVAALPAALAVWFANNTPVLMFCAAFSFAIYLGLYWFVATMSRTRLKAQKELASEGGLEDKRTALSA